MLTLIQKRLAPTQCQHIEPLPDTPMSVKLTGLAHSEATNRNLCLAGDLGRDLRAVLSKIPTPIRFPACETLNTSARRQKNNCTSVVHTYELIRGTHTSKSSRFRP